MGLDSKTVCPDLKQEGKKERKKERKKEKELGVSKASDWFESDTKE
jgi:hypothetical protein